MATFAKIGLNSQIIDVINVENSACLDSEGNFDETIGAEFLSELHRWPAANFKHSNQNMRNGVLYEDDGEQASDQSAAYRKHGAELGGTFDSVRNAFLPVQPYASWTFNYTNWVWDPPSERPADVVDGTPRKVVWNEDTTSWDIS